MDTITALLGGIGRGLRWVFDLASMAFGVAPTSAPIASLATPDEACAARLHVADGALRPEDDCEFSSIFRREVGLDPY